MGLLEIDGVRDWQATYRSHDDLELLIPPIHRSPTELDTLGDYAAAVPSTRGRDVHQPFQTVHLELPHQYRILSLAGVRQEVECPTGGHGDAGVGVDSLQLVVKEDLRVGRFGRDCTGQRIRIEATGEIGLTVVCKHQVGVLNRDALAKPKGSVHGPTLGTREHGLVVCEHGARSGHHDCEHPPEPAHRRLGPTGDVEYDTNETMTGG